MLSRSRRRRSLPPRPRRQAKLEEERRAAAAAREASRAAARALAQQREAAAAQQAIQLRERVSMRLKEAAQRRCGRAPEPSPRRLHSGPSASGPRALRRPATHARALRPASAAASTGCSTWR